MASQNTYYAVSTLEYKPENQEKVIEFFNRVSQETKDKEPAALIYRWYKVEGKNEFVFMEKFESERDYRAHQQSAHVQGLYKEYLPYLTDTFVFHSIDTSGDRMVGGFER